MSALSVHTEDGDTSPPLTKNYEYVENVCTCYVACQNVILTAA